MEFFDSYGRQPSINSGHFKRWISNHAKTINTDDIQLQSDASDLCGRYAILFLHQRFKGYSMQEIISVFDSVDLQANDSFVYSLISQAYCDCCIA